MDRCLKLQASQQTALSKITPTRGTAPSLMNAKSTPLRRVALSDGTCCYSPRYQNSQSGQAPHGRGALRVIGLVLLLVLLLQWGLPSEG